MIVLDASCLYEVLIDGPHATAVRRVLADADEVAAPHAIDVEVMGAIRSNWQVGLLHETRAEIALAELRDWSGERFPHRPFADRVWELRHNVRTWDAYYVALAEVLRAPLVTLDRRLAHSNGPTCEFIVP